VNKRIRFFFSGVVQGVGFRPFIYRLAVRHGLAGWVQNRTDGVIAEVEGPANAVEHFLSDVSKELPPLAEIAGIIQEETTVTGDRDFRILPSEAEGQKIVRIPPDIAVCADCLHELFDPADRRYRYPFINCTNCGPRLTIIRDVPYDRANTSMACFPLCPRCREEYENPADRRFHAEPNACPVCGPHLEFLDERGESFADSDPLRRAIAALREGSVVAIKGLGGFHLAVDATNGEAVKRLRSRKFREEKPLALMVRDLETAIQIAELGVEEKDLLLTPQRPIVLAKKTSGTWISSAVAPGVPNQGIMLPYTPLHHLLLQDPLRALIMTSANHVDEPICIGNHEAVARLQGIADFFLIHNRDILVRCDDSIATVASGRRSLLRRSRGFAPKPLILRESYPEVLALGPQLKTTLCILKENLAFLSPHIGDLETPQARDFHRESLSLLQKIAECKPDVVACDLHPAYYTTLAAEKMEGVKVVRVQHHHAHIVSGMAENGITGEVIGLAMDGTGYGTDGTAWGGEFLLATEASFTRIGHLKPFLLPGGEKAVHEPWRIGVSLLREAFGEKWPEVSVKLGLVPEPAYYKWMDHIFTTRINSPLTSSLGRVFDGVAAILGLHRKVSFEGQAAMELEALAQRKTEAVYPFDIREDQAALILDLSPVIRGVVEALEKDVSREEIAFAFHNTLVKALTDMATEVRRRTGFERTVLSGGCFQNRLLLERSIAELGKAGFAVFFHELVPTNDGCISLGQAVSAGAQIKKGCASTSLCFDKLSMTTENSA
jgi:hydrogenase maturation protein HypF